MRGYGRCPRCGGWTLEYLRTHAHCPQCNYFPGDNAPSARWSIFDIFNSEISLLHRTRIGVDRPISNPHPKMSEGTL